MDQIRKSISASGDLDGPLRSVGIVTRRLGNPTSVALAAMEEYLRVNEDKEMVAQYRSHGGFRLLGNEIEERLEAVENGVPRHGRMHRVPNEYRTRAVAGELMPLQDSSAHRRTEESPRTSVRDFGTRLPPG